MTNPSLGPQQEWECAKLEYENALQQLRTYSDLGRKDVVFVTAVQGAILTILNQDLLRLNVYEWMLSGIAFAIAIAGINTERRLYSYMSAYTERAREIELKYSMQLLTRGRDRISARRVLFSNTAVFRFFYSASAIAWVAIWALNIWKW